MRVLLLKSTVLATAKSTKVYVEVQISEKHNLHITEYGGYITAVNVVDVKTGKVLYKSTKYSIQDALIWGKYKASDAEQVKLEIVVIRKAVKAAYKASLTAKEVPVTAEDSAML